MVQLPQENSIFTRTVRRAAGEDRLSHAVILTGRGDLTAAARFLAAAHVCEGTDRPCLRCRHCRKVLEGIHPDVIPVLDTEHKELTVEAVRARVRMCTSAPTRPGARYTSSLTAAS